MKRTHLEQLADEAFRAWGASDRAITWIADAIQAERATAELIAREALQAAARRRAAAKRRRKS